MYVHIHRCMHSSMYYSLVIFSPFPTEATWLKVIRRSLRARCLPMPSLCRRAVRNIRKRTQRFQSTLQSFPRSAQRGGRYLNLWLPEGITSYSICWDGVCVSEREGSQCCFWGVCCSWQAVLAIGQVLLKPVAILNILALCICPFRCFHCSLAFFTVPKQCPSAATSFQVCVPGRTLAVLVSLLLFPCCWICQCWLWFPVQDLRPQGGPVRKQTKTETPISSWCVGLFT